MPACTACGNHLSTDYLHVFGNDDAAIGSCPNCAASPDTAEGQGAAVAPARPAAEDGEATSKPAPATGSTDANSSIPPLASATEPPHEGRSESPRADGPAVAESTDDGSEFTVRTAGRSLEPSLGASDAGQSRPERSGSASHHDGRRLSRDRERSPSVLSSILDVFR